MTGMIESRPWLPRYRAMVISNTGATLATKNFFFLSNARAWAYAYAVETRT